MHLLATTSGVIDGAAEAVDLKQAAGDVVILSAADSELANLARAVDMCAPNTPSVRLANLLHLQHNYSVDLYAERTLASAKLIVVRMLGGASYWRYGLETLAALAKERNIAFAVLPGAAEQSSDLQVYSTLSALECERLRQYLAAGGPQNAARFLQLCFHLIRKSDHPAPPEKLDVCGFYRVNHNPGLRVALIFYRSVIEGGQSAPIDQLCDALEKLGAAVQAVFVASLKDETSSGFIRAHLSDYPPDVVINATAFAVGSVDRDPLAGFDCPVLQVSLAGTTEQNWRENTRGLAPSDLAMSVVIPEIDGRIYTRAISFKADAQWHEKTQCRIVTYQPIPDRIGHVAELAVNWARLRHTANAKKRVAIVLANYPNKDGRIANGVGYDTPASTVAILNALAQNGYNCCRIPLDGNILIETLQAGRTNAASGKVSAITLLVADYKSYFKLLPQKLQFDVEQRWGASDTDAWVMAGAFQLPLVGFGDIVVGVQPARGYNIDPKSSYHDPALVPPHGYFAFYFWIRFIYGAHAIIHNGKHGNLEWLPGKAVALTAECYPEATLGALPQLYPFIVNDPGEGTQAKRRTSAVIIDHLTPPLTRAESYGSMKDLEALVDEFYQASGMDKRRIRALKKQILELSRSTKMDVDVGFSGDEDRDLERLDAYLCDLKEAQIRDGLHVLGASPVGAQEADLLVALTRVARGLGEGGDQSLIRAMAADLALPFDPLQCDFAEAWRGPKPALLQAMSKDYWRSHGDTVERLELLALQFVTDGAPADMPATALVLSTIERVIRPALRACGPSEMVALLRGLSGRAVAPGPSGAPTRGRVDVLPTGRNFFSIDNRTLPTPTAWMLGRASADALLTRHFQDTGQHLVTAVLSAWGTANMRTGGDDIAQAMALLGVRPTWDPSSWRVTGYEVLPIAALGRPRVDVTLRISGFFRDAFPSQIELLDRAIAAIANLDEAASDNPLAQSVKREAEQLVAGGVDGKTAQSLSTRRIFGSKPGTYGAGLQTLIDEGIWETRADLAAAFVTWGAYAYGVAARGEEHADVFKRRLANVQAVIHNQDNREHDLLDSDDYYQFEGGLSAAVEVASGKKPTVYHNDHSRPERPVIRTLDEEVARVVRSRVVNPKWINGVMRHGYKGAFEIAATVDYMFAFAATADAVKSHHFDMAYDAYLVDEKTRTFIANNNPAALREIAARFEEAIARGLWQPRLNSVYEHLKDLQT